ncbi:MAG: tetratricopeptide repeat protein, partial [Vitreimonas sp.]
AEKVARAMRADGRTAEGCDILSCALRELGRWKEAAQAAEEALTLEPGNVQALHSRAAAWTFLGRDRDALDMLETLTVRGVETPALWYFRSKALINLKRYGEAAGLLADGLRKWPASDRLRIAYAELLSRPR